MKKYELITNDENINQTINDDVLKRNIRLKNLIKLISGLQDNYIISIDGNWGSGKTFFVKQLVYINQHYEQIEFCKTDNETFEKFSNNYFVIYYNAWENDDHINPLESLLYKILNDFPKYKDFISSTNDKFNIAKKLLMNFIDKSSFGIISRKDLEDINTFENLAESIYTIEEKKTALNELLNIIIGNKRLLLIIDELDRCKPDYAVKMLETIKHFFDNNKVTSIVVTDNKQLSSTILHYYGNNFDGYGYLNKIYDTVITLGSENIENYAKHYLNIFKTTNLSEDISVLLFHFFEFSYRECNKYMSMYKIVEPYINWDANNNSNKYTIESCVFLPFALALKIKNIDLYNKFINGKDDTFLKKFFSDSFPIKFNKEYLDWFKEIFKTDEKENLFESVLKKYNLIFNNKTTYFSFPYTEAISLLGNNIDIN